MLRDRLLQASRDAKEDYANKKEIVEFDRQK
jgi:hypothetical protein